MKMKRILVAALLTLMLFFALFPAAVRQVGAHSGVSLSGFATTPPTLDGNIQAAEWVAAATRTFGPLTVGSQTITGTLYMMNDGVNLYTAVKIDGDDDFGSTDGFEVYFDNDHGGGASLEGDWLAGDDCLRANGASGFNDLYWYGAGTTYDPIIDGQAAGGRQGSSNHFELSHPLDSADDAHDISLSAGQTVGFQVLPWIDDVGLILWTWGLGSSLPDDFANYVVASPFSSVKGSVIDAAAGAVYFIYPDYDPTHAKPNGAAAAALSDFTALGVLYGMTVNVQSECLDTSPACVEQPIGRPSMTGKAVVLVGGQSVHASVRYYDNQRIAPVYPTVEGTMYYWYTRAGVKLTSTAFDSTLFGNGISYHQDMFVIEYFMDGNGNAVFIIYGYGWKGSFAGGRYFKSTIYPNIASYTHAYYIYQWNDLNNDGFPDLNEITLVTSGD